MSQPESESDLNPTDRIGWLGVGLFTARYFLHDFGGELRPETGAWESRGDFRNSEFSFPLSALRTAFAVRVLMADGWEFAERVRLVKEGSPGAIGCTVEADPDTGLRLGLEGLEGLNGKAEETRNALANAVAKSTAVFAAAEVFLRREMPRVSELLFREAPLDWPDLEGLDDAAQEELAAFLRKHFPVLAAAAGDFK